MLKRNKKFTLLITIIFAFSLFSLVPAFSEQTESESVVSNAYLKGDHKNQPDTYFDRDDKECGGVNAPVVWHFVIPGNNKIEQATIFATFTNAGTLIAEGFRSGQGQGTIHFYIGTPTNDTIIDAYANLTLSSGSGTFEINVSHVCYKETPIKGNICGYKFEDKDNDGSYDPEIDEMKSGWTIIFHKDVEGSFVELDSTTTSSDGTFCFEDLPYGIYKVTEENVTGWTQTAPGGNGYYIVTLDEDGMSVNNELINNLVFGNHNNNNGGNENGNICGYKFEDKDNDGSYDPEIDEMKSGWTIILHEDVEGSFVELDSTPTSNDGTFCFEDLPYGIYKVTEENVTGWTQTAPGGSGYYIVTLDEDGMSVNDELFDNLVFGNHYNNNGGNEKGNICGYKFEDKDNDGSYDPEIDEMKSGWTIILHEDVEGSFVELDSTPTSNDGTFCFEDLPYGIYKVTEENVTGWTQTTPGGNGYFIVDLNEDGIFVDDQPIDRLVFGNYKTNNGGGGSEKTGSICGYKYRGADGNAIQQGWTIYLYNQPLGNGETLGSGAGYLRQINTNAQGQYCFTNLELGTYYIYEENRPQWTQVVNDDYQAYHVVPLTDTDYTVANKNFRNLPPGGGGSGGSGGGTTTTTTTTTVEPITVEVPEVAAPPAEPVVTAPPVEEPVVVPEEPKADLPFTGGNAAAFIGAGMALAAAGAVWRRKFLGR